MVILQRDRDVAVTFRTSQRGSQKERLLDALNWGLPLPAAAPRSRCA